MDKLNNTGLNNSGNGNSGDWNSGNWNSGNFNTGTPNKIQVFNQWVEMTQEEFGEKYNIYADLPLNRWIDISNIENPTPKQAQMGGYLKTLDFKEACQIWWSENEDRHKDFLELPHFNPEIFEEITGIKVNEEVEEMTMEDLCKELGRTIKIKK